MTSTIGPPTPGRRGGDTAAGTSRALRNRTVIVAGIALLVMAGAGLTYAWLHRVPTGGLADSIAAEPTPGTAGPTTVHGRSISTRNTGYLAWVGADGQRCTDATLKVYRTKVNASDLGDATCVWLKQGLTVDTAITLTAARIDAEVSAEKARLTLNWSTVDATGADWAVGYQVDAYRSQLLNGSDGVRFDDTNIVESYVRVRQVSRDDHNDGVQAYEADRGGSILRSNIDARPVNARSIAGNAAIFIADHSKGEVVIRDNWLAGGGYTLRLHDACTYRVTGNILSGWMFEPFGDDNAIRGAFLEWANNTTDSGGAVQR